MSVAKDQEWADGEEQAWYSLTLSAPAEVCKRTEARFDEDSATYALRVFNANVEICPGHQKISGRGNLSRLLLEKLPHLSRLSILWYLVQGQDIPASGRLVNPRELDGGLIFDRGSHMLPLDKLAVKYGDDTETFLKKGAILGGEPHDYGDDSIMLSPFLRVPVLLVLWRKDIEFPAGAELLLDATCSGY